MFDESQYTHSRANPHLGVHCIISILRIGGARRRRRSNILKFIFSISSTSSPPFQFAQNFEVYNLTSVLLLMRFPSFPNLVRTLYTLSNATARLQSPLRGNTYISPFSRTAVLRSMPSLPFLSSFFGTSAPASETMSYPDGRSNDEWRAVLNKGASYYLQIHEGAR